MLGTVNYSGVLNGTVSILPNDLLSPLTGSLGAAEESPSSSTPIAMLNSTSTNYRSIEHCAPDHTSHMYDGASLVAAQKMFRVEFYDSIQRRPSKTLPNVLVADVSMVFPESTIRDQFGCQLAVEIAQEKVASYAREFFDVEVECKDGVRFVRYPRSSKIEPDPSICIRGFLPEKLLRIFKDMEECRAVYASPIYLREIAEVRERTDTVSMRLSNRAKDGATINVFLGEYRAAQIKERLFGQAPLPI